MHKINYLKKFPKMKLLNSIKAENLFNLPSDQMSSNNIYEFGDGV